MWVSQAKRERGREQHWDRLPQSYFPYGNKMKNYIGLVVSFLIQWCKILNARFCLLRGKFCHLWLTFGLMTSTPGIIASVFLTSICVLISVLQWTIVYSHSVHSALLLARPRITHWSLIYNDIFMLSSYVLKIIFPTHVHFKSAWHA